MRNLSKESCNIAAILHYYIMDSAKITNKPICSQVSTCVTQRFSGISEEDVKGNHTSLRKVQETLLSFINADTILIGHSLETDLCALKVTTISFP